VLLWFDVCWCYGVVRLGWCGIRMQAEACIRIPRSNTAHEITQQISRKLLRMDVLTFETCGALNNEIIKQVTSSWSIFIQLARKYIWRGQSVTNLLSTRHQLSLFSGVFLILLARLFSLPLGPVVTHQLVTY